MGGRATEDELARSKTVSLRAASIRRAPEQVELALQGGALGRRLGGFEFGKQIGRGGMGTVWQADDRLLGRSVAVKVLADAGQDPGLLRRFVVEAQLGAQLEHPNIVPFYEFTATSKGEPAFAMKLVDGETFEQYLRECSDTAEQSRTPPYDLRSRLDRFLKVCDAIDYAHARGVVHRDLKPSNVMLGQHNEVYVMDWGVASVLDDAGGVRDAAPPQAKVRDERLTADGEVIGTPAYMAPEQAGAQPVSEAADQYALGMMLAEVVTLCAPRRGSTSQQLSQALLGAPPLLEPRFDGPLPKELCAIITKATQRAAERRYPSVRAMALDVQRFLRDEPVSVLRDARVSRLWRRLKRRPAVVFGIVACLLLTCLVVVVVALARELSARRRAAEQTERVFALTAAVQRTARGVDARLSRLELLLEGMTRAAREMRMQQPPPAAAHGTELAPLTPSAMAESGLAIFTERYAQKVSFERPVLVPSPEVLPSAVVPVSSRLSHYEALLAMTAARAAIGDVALTQSPAEQRSAARDRSPILWTDLAFEEGAMLVYPGNTFFPPDYDARQRTWYLAAARTPGHVWGQPYPDATSGRLLVPCSMAFRYSDGRLAGVAAFHMLLSDVHGALGVPGAPGYLESTLLDAQGNVIVSERTDGAQMGPGIHDNEAIVSMPFAVAAVRDAVRAGAQEGRFIEGPRLVVLQNLHTAGWLLAVSVDAATYGL